jgi:hypothetical protein
VLHLPLPYLCCLETRKRLARRVHVDLGYVSGTLPLHHRLSRLWIEPFYRSASIASSIAMPLAQPHQQRKRQVKEDTEQTWFGFPWATDPQLRPMHRQWSKRGDSLHRAEERGVADIPAPMIADREPKGVTVEAQQQ